jgi:oxygen-independent coproporphyrinogen-3 oxidase
MKIFLNDYKYRHEIFQMYNMFYPFEDIVFTDNAYDISIMVDEHKVNITHRKNEKELIYSLGDDTKNALKQIIYKYLSELLGKELPWGILVGIRPSKIAVSLIETGLSREEIINKYINEYYTTIEKAKLCVDIAELEAKVLKNTKEEVSIYIGMPFCPTRCSYCSFASNPIEANKSIVEPYLKALSHEIRSLSEYIAAKKLKIHTVYFGGGTPTSVSNEQFENIMSELHKNFILNRGVKEFTVECGRPDSITIEKLKTMKNYEVGRISINPQTMNNKTLKRIGRNHSVEDVIEKYNIAREMGFDNINMDIIVGLPGEGLEEIKKTCDEIFKLQPDNLTVHGMSVKRASKLHEERIIGNQSSEQLIVSDLEKVYEETRLLSEALQMKPYYMYRQKNMIGNMENVGYTKDNKECIYNIEMIEEKQTIIALGADGVSKIVFLDENRIERVANVKDVREYIQRRNEMIEKKLNLLNTLYIS